MAENADEKSDKVVDDVAAENDDNDEEDPAARSLSRALSTSFGLLKLVMLGIVVFIIFNCIKTVDEGYVGIKQRFGAYVVNGQGVVHYKPGSAFVWPAPIEKLYLIPKGPQTLVLKKEFWPKQDPQMMLPTGGQVLAAEPILKPGKSAYNLTGDRNIVHSQWKIEYQIVDPVRYLEASAWVVKEQFADVPLPLRRTSQMQTAADLVRRAATSAIMRVLAGMSVDEILVDDNSRTLDMSERVLAEVNAELKKNGEYRWGIKVQAVNNTRVSPPGITIPMFSAVSAASSQSKEMLEQARQAADKTIAEAGTEADRILYGKNGAEVIRQRIVRTVESDAKVFTALLAKFPNDPGGLQVYLEEKRQHLIRTLIDKGKITFISPGAKAVVTIGAALSEDFDTKQKEPK